VIQFRYNYINTIIHVDLTTNGHAKCNTTVYFASVMASNNVKCQLRSPAGRPEDNLSELLLSLDDVLSALLNLVTNKATGPDGIPAKLLTETSHQIAPFLCWLFNQSLQSGFLTEECKLANVTPVFKKGDKSCVESHRPISLLCIIYPNCWSAVC
jgi:hypothetical protein